MASREESLEAENGRLVSEMASMKKKIKQALKKQQAELQAKIQAAEQRAEAAMQSSSSSLVCKSTQSDEICSPTSSGGELQGEIAKLRAELEDERSRSTKQAHVKDQMEIQLEQLRRTVEEQKNELRDMDELSKANQKLEAQAVAEAKQVSDAFSRVEELRSQLESVSREKETVRVSYTDLAKEHERISMELANTGDRAAKLEQEMKEMLASHKSTQEGQAAAMSQLMKQLEAMQTSSEPEALDASELEGLRKDLSEKIKTIEALQTKYDENMRHNDSLRAEVLELKDTNERLLNESPLPTRESVDERNEGASAAAEKFQSLLEENSLLKERLEREMKEQESKYAELDQKFSRLQKRAKQRIQEVQKEKEDAEAQLTAKHASLQNDLERFRNQAGEAIRALDAERQSLRNANLKLKEEVDEAKRLLDLKEHNLAESRRLASEKDQTALSIQAEMKELQGRHASEISVLDEKKMKAIEELENQLNDARMETNKLAEIVTAQQGQLAQKEAKLADAEAVLTGEVARLSAAVEAAKVEAKTMKEEQENEQQQWHSKAAKFVSKIQELESVCQQIEQEALETKRRLESEIETLRKELFEAQKTASAARNETDCLRKDFNAYKLRAHALLQKKEAELREARDVDLAAAQEASLKDAQREAALAVAERNRAVSSLKQAVAEYETQLAARNVTVIDAEQRIKELATKLESTKGLLAYEREEWQKDAQQLDSSWREKCEELASKQATSTEGKIKNELAMLQMEYERLKADYESYRDMTNQMMEAKDQKLAELLEDNNNLQKSQSQKVESETNGHSNAESNSVDESSVIAAAEQQILILARQQAQREEEVKQCQRQVDVLQEEIADLESENRLHRQQETMLKEELRNMERATKRNGVDMTYLKNVILKLLETGEAEALLPVVGTLLQFSPDEVKRCQEAYANAMDIASVATPRSLLSRWSFANGR